MSVFGPWITPAPVTTYPQMTQRFVSAQGPAAVPGAPLNASMISAINGNLFGTGFSGLESCIALQAGGGGTYTPSIAGRHTWVANNIDSLAFANPSEAFQTQPISSINIDFDETQPGEVLSRKLVGRLYYTGPSTGGISLRRPTSGAYTDAGFFNITPLWHTPTMLSSDPDPIVFASVSGLDNVIEHDFDWDAGGVAYWSASVDEYMANGPAPWWNHFATEVHFAYWGGPAGVPPPGDNLYFQNSLYVKLTVQQRRYRFIFPTTKAAGSSGGGTLRRLRQHQIST